MMLKNPLSLTAAIVLSLFMMTTQGASADSYRNLGDVDFSQYYKDMDDFKNQALRCNNYAFHQRRTYYECTLASAKESRVIPIVSKAKTLLANPQLAHSTDRRYQAYTLVKDFEAGQKLLREAYDRIGHRR